MRVGFDATPLLGRRTGVGTYVASLFQRLATMPGVETVATAFTWRGSDGLPEVVPDGSSVRRTRVPARLVNTLWQQVQVPTVELLCGDVELFHGTNFLLPPTRSASGVLTIHDLAYLRFPDTVSSASSAYRRLVPAGVRRADMVIVPSYAVGQQVQDAYGLLDDQIAVTHLGVDKAWFEAEPASPAFLAGLGVSGPYVVAAGTLEPRKNIGALLEAYRLQTARGQALPTLVVAGGSGWGKALDRDVLASVAPVLTGHLPIGDLRRLVAGAQLLVFPSIDEGFGLPPLEALAAGVPVAASGLDVCREVLGDQATFFDPWSPEDVAGQVALALATPTGTRPSRRRHATRFTWERCAAETLQAYERAVARHR